jgi:hypothetical protein
LQITPRIKLYGKKAPQEKITKEIRDYSDKDSSVFGKQRANGKTRCFLTGSTLRVPLFVLKNCKINKLSLTTKKELHSMVYSNIRMCNPSSLVDILHNAEKLNLAESKSELDYISKIIENPKI